MRILHLEDDSSDALIIARTLRRVAPDVDIVHVSSADEFRRAVEAGNQDAAIVDNGVPGFNARAALAYAHEQRPDLPVIVCSGAASNGEIIDYISAGAADFVLKDALWQFNSVLPRVVEAAQQHARLEQLQHHQRAMHQLIDVVQQLSLARDLDSVMKIVRHAARELTGADGATFVLRDHDKCFYADEEAISPLWKGQRFPLQACISGWAMLNKQSVAIEDIYADARIPADAYRPTFVKSLAMVPIRTHEPIGAIGNYWAQRHQPTAEELELLQSLANTTAVAIENVQLYAELEQRVAQRTQELEQANRELEAFSYAVSHDLRAPLRSVSGQLQIIVEDFMPQLPEAVSNRIEQARLQAQRMNLLINDLLRLSQLNQAPLNLEPINLSDVVNTALARLHNEEPERTICNRIEPDLQAVADFGLIAAAIENLVGNAWKYSRHREEIYIEFGRTPDGTYFLKDHGAGFNMEYAAKLFQPFQRLHSTSEFPGTGVGLATVRRIIERHGGTIRAEAQPNVGATFYFTLPAR